jgi:uncharacterized protein HemY
VINIDGDHFKARLLQDCLTQATAQHWLDRAKQFEDAIPRRTDFYGRAAAADVAAQIERCQGAALACRRHAELIMASRPEPISAEVRDAVEEVP